MANTPEIVLQYPVRSHLVRCSPNLRRHHALSPGVLYLATKIRSDHRTRSSDLLPDLEDSMYTSRYLQTY